MELEATTESKLKVMSLGALKTRQALGRYLLKKVRNEWRYEFPDKWKATEARLEEQIRRITVEIRLRNRAKREAAGIPKPPPEVVGLKPARLGAKTKQQEKPR